MPNMMGAPVHHVLCVCSRNAQRRHADMDPPIAREQARVSALHQDASYWCQAVVVWSADLLVVYLARSDCSLMSWMSASV